MLNIIDAIEHEGLGFRHYLGGKLKSWKNWRACLKAVYGLPFAERIVPALPHLREIAVLGLLGIAGALAYAGTLLAVMGAFGLRLRRR